MNCNFNNTANKQNNIVNNNLINNYNKIFKIKIKYYKKSI